MESPALKYLEATGQIGQDSAGTPGPPVLAPFRRRLMATDLGIILVSVAIGLGVSSRATAWAINFKLAVYGTPVVIVVLWFAVLLLRGAYDQRVIGVGTEEIRRLASGTIATFAVVAGVSFLIRADISRAYAFVSLPLGLLGMAVSHVAWRTWLYRRREHHDLVFDTLVVGSGMAAKSLTDTLNSRAFAGFAAVADYPSPPHHDGAQQDEWMAGLLRRVDDSGVRAIALAPSDNLRPQVIREISWLLESRSVDVLVAPAIMAVGGPRLSIRPAAGIPLLHLDQVALSRPQRAVKRSMDLLGSALLIVLLSPLLVALAVAVKASSRGPVFFRQTRVGRGGLPFTMWKFRTMRPEADAQREQLRDVSASKGATFKMMDDPRVTSVGRHLRRWSLDELPQLFNVLLGTMSLVGPRPHPDDDVARYELFAFRRLALKPGMTGLWQVAGRSSLDWEEAIELDLYYVETWSLAGDVVLLARTTRAVIAGDGAH